MYLAEPKFPAAYALIYVLLIIFLLHIIWTFFLMRAVYRVLTAKV